MQEHTKVPQQVQVLNIQVQVLNMQVQVLNMP
jgi:hypothetical protein